jgi:phosphatidylglycerol:prolipoprotein diacylglycerol transferase
MSVAGIAAVVVYVMLRRRKLGLPTDDLIHIVLFAVIGAMVGAKVLYLVTMIPVIMANFGRIIHDPELIKAFLTQGYVFYGGLFGALLAVWIYCRKFSVDFKAASMLFAGGIPLFHVFGRLGCFSAGCCYGVDAPWGVVFTQSLSAPNGEPLVPIQLFEAGANVLIFTGVTLFQRRSKHPEKALTVYLVSYAVCRFILEFFRGDIIRGGILGVSTSQWISLGILVYFAARPLLLKVPRLKNVFLKEGKA